MLTMLNWALRWRASAYHKASLAAFLCLSLAFASGQEPSPPIDDSAPPPKAHKQAPPEPAPSPNTASGQSKGATTPQTTPAQTTPAPSPAGTGTQTPVPQVTLGLVTNAFVDTDIKVAVSESAAQAGVTVIVDDTIKEQNISIEFKSTPIEDVLDRLALFVG